MTLRTGIIVGISLGALALAGGRARADDVDDFNRKLIDLDQRVREMLAEFKDNAPPPPDVADRRVLDAQVLFNLKNYEEGDHPAGRRREVPELAGLRRRRLPAG